TCDTCHDGMSPGVLSISHFGECVTCHENHAVVRPTIAMLGLLPDSPCAFCHEATTTVLEPAGTMERYLEMKETLMTVAGASGLRGEERFDWLVDQALQLPTHTLRAPGDQALQLRPEFTRLFEKFRIGKTHYTYDDPISGTGVRVRVRQCADCHVDPDSTGMRTARAQLSAMSRIIGGTARAERILLAARRGGVEVHAAQEALDGAVDSQIELEVLVHAFDSGGEFAAKLKEGSSLTEEALAAGQSSLQELSFRRRGLLGALGIIVLVLVGLGMKIRRMSHEDERQTPR
ncbi:MAG TPA: hypothetical protein VM534_10285, partial [Thermoanaerobaculia bacterium]|nr:hypothetical protein [Thermoanaerobaculia bacterium]